jgi:dolichol-phosphate mannosyltransferase
LTPELSVVVPTFNERENIPLVIRELSASLEGWNWEVVFVDDDSIDGTADVVSAHAKNNPRVRLIHRIGRRGLSSACMEGMLSSQAPLLAVMDADLQHDASILPRMIQTLQQGSHDVVVGTRNADGGSMGEFCKSRVILSRTGQRLSQCICRCKLSDPMSGFFLIRRSFLMEVVRDVRGEGFKILVDMLSSAHRPVRLAEVGYTFRARTHGESKLDAAVAIEYLFLVLNKMLGDVISVHLTLFMLVGSIGLILHLLTLLYLVDAIHVHFLTAQMIATFLAMTENFVLNNRITFRDRRLKGKHLLPGILRFAVTCSFGAWANFIFTRALWQSGVEWLAAGFAGIMIASVWNLSVSSFVTWPVRRHSADERPAYDPAMAGNIEVTH